MPRKKDTELHAKRRQELLKAAKRCFIAEGFHQTSMRQIFVSAGLSAGGAYNYFASKADIVKGIVEEDRADIEVLELRLSSKTNPLEGLGQLVSDIIGYTNHKDAVLATEIYAEACRNPEIGALTSANAAQLMGIISAAIVRGQKAGTITNEHRVTDLTEWVMALLEGYVGRIASEPKLKSITVARFAKKAVLHLLKNQQ